MYDEAVHAPTSVALTSSYTCSPVHGASGGGGEGGGGEGGGEGGGWIAVYTLTSCRLSQVDRGTKIVTTRPVARHSTTKGP